MLTATDFRFLDYPLNVYASLLHLEYGRADYLSYGVLHAGRGQDAVRGTPDLKVLPQAQQEVVKLLQDRLEPAPARVLEVGFGLGTLARQLAAGSYEVTAISSSRAETAIAQALDSRATYLCRRFEDFDSSERFDCLIFHNSAHYLCPLQLLGKALQLLKPGGLLLICDEFAADTGRVDRQPMPELECFLQLAQRLAYQLQARTDMSAGVKAFFPLLLTLFDRHVCRLPEITGESPQRLAELRKALAKDEKRFACGGRSQQLLELRTENADPVAAASEARPEYCTQESIRPEEVKPLFEQSFGQQFDAAIWNWKYGGGRGRAVGARVEGRLVAHYGGAPRQILYFGTPSRAIQICDVMVLPEKRGFFSRNGLFFKTAATFLELQIGYSAEHLLGFGFPNIKAMHVAARLGLYAKTDELIELRYPPCSDLSTDLSCSRASLDDSLLCNAVDTLWEEMRADFAGAIIGVRNSSYLQYRYLHHPDPSYRCVAIRKPDGDCLAVAVLKPHGESLLLMDLICPVNRMGDAMSSLREYAVDQGSMLLCWISGGHAGALELPGSSRHDLGIEIPCNIWSAGPGPDQLQQAWWLSAGDMDFM